MRTGSPGDCLLISGNETLYTGVLPERPSAVPLCAWPWKTAETG